MARNGSGTYNLYTPGNPVVTGTTISSTWANNTLNDIATGLTNSIAKDGQTTPTANLPMGTFKHTNLGVGTVSTDSINLGQAQNAAYQYLASVSGSNTITASISPAITAYAAGQVFRFVASASNTGATTININSLGAKAITKYGTTALSTGDILINGIYEVVYNGTQFQLINSSIEFSGGTVANATTFNSDITMSGSMDKWAKGADVASATALPLITDGNYFDVTGTTTITSFNSVGVGTWIRLHFDAALTLTHNATDLILPSGANITTAAGDEAEFIEYASGDYRCVSYTKANGTAVVGGITGGTAIATTSGTSHDYLSIASSVKRITLQVVGVSTSGTSVVQVQLGTSGGVVNTGYTGVSDTQTSGGGSATSLTSGLGLERSGVGSNTTVRGGRVVIDNVVGTNTWVMTYQGYITTSSTSTSWGTATITLGAALDRIRLTTVNGTDTFDAGSINILLE